MSVSAVGDWFVLIVLEGNMLQETVGDILHNVPLHREIACPLVLLPILDTLVKINSPRHLCQSYKLPAGINLDKIQKESLAQRH